MFDIHAPLILQGCTYFADKNVMKGSLLDNLGWCRPTAFLGVPRVWEKIMEKMLEKARDQGVEEEDLEGGQESWPEVQH